ncbi:hypothetical protein KUV89_18465 [Marinobacter hydrocarbonoclasticus]|nr:hypothetical protein [Marinobacter nauticus]
MNRIELKVVMVALMVAGCGGGDGGETAAPETPVIPPPEQATPIRTEDLVATPEMDFNEDYTLALTVTATPGHTLLVYQYDGGEPTAEQRLMMVRTGPGDVEAQLRLGPQSGQLLLQLWSADPTMGPRQQVVSLPRKVYHWQP